MKVKCVNTGGKDLLEADIARGNTRSSVFHVTEGQEYRVYGVLFHRSVVSYLIQEDTALPMWNPASLFQVICGRASRHWIIADWSSEAYITAMTFQDFVSSPEAFDKLAVSDDSARETFRKWKQISDLEFLDPGVKKTAEAIEGKWVLCPVCAEAWEAPCADAMVRCPECQSVMRNPRYEEKPDLGA